MVEALIALGMLSWGLSLWYAAGVKAHECHALGSGATLTRKQISRILLWAIVFGWLSIPALVLIGARGVVRVVRKLYVEAELPKLQLPARHGPKVMRFLVEPIDDVDAGALSVVEPEISQVKPYGQHVTPRVRELECGVADDVPGFVTRWIPKDK